MQGCVSRLRKALGGTAIETTAAGYRLRLHRDDLDHVRFEHHVGRGRELLATGEPDRALYLLDQALALWRGDPFADLSEWEPGRTEAERLIELRRDAEELRAEAALQSGGHDDVVPDLKRLVAEQPTRERRWGLLALAQYQAGRQADALQTIRRAKAVLLNGLGLDPGPGLAALEESILRQDSSLVAQSAFAPVSATCPYLGLLPYDLADASAFFGREADTEAALRRLDQVGVLAVVGPSGSGKSSLIRAGVAAALERDGRQVAVLTPGQLPLAALDAARPHAADVLVVDQSEEALALPEDSGERADFFDRLVGFAAGPGRQLLISLRADRLGDLSVHSEFARLVERGLYLLGPLRELDLRRAIEGPAAQAGLRIEAGLVDLLVREVLGESGALPLLSHVLRQTWKHREGNTLTVAGYTATGGIRGAVSQSAEGLFRGLTGVQQTMVRDLMVRLVAADDAGAPIRQRVPRRSVLTNQERQEVAERLIAARLLSSDGDTLEVAHESLAVAWPRLRGWLDDDVDGLRIMRHLAVAAETWDELGRPESELYRGVRLARAVEWRDRSQPTLTPVEDDFLAASAALADREAHAAEEQARRDRRSNQRLRLALAATAAVLAVAVVAGVAAFTAAERATSTALRSDSERLGAEAARVEAVDLALLLAAAGMQLQESVESRTSLLEALDRVPRLVRVTHAPAFVMAVLADGGVVLSEGEEGVRVHDPTTLAVVGRNEAARGVEVVASPTGELLAASLIGEEGRPVLLLRPDGTPDEVQLDGFPRKSVTWQDLSFDPTGRWLSVGIIPTDTGPANVLVWDLARRTRPILRLETSQSSMPIVSGDGRTLYSRDEASILVTNVHDGSTRRVVTAADLGVRSLSGQLLLTPDSRTLIVGGGPETVVIDAETMRPRAHLYDGQAWSHYLALSRDGTRLAIVGDRVLVVDLSGDEPTLVANEALPGNAVGLSPDGTTLYVAAQGNLASIDLTGEHGFLALKPGQGLRDEAPARLSSDGTKAAFHHPNPPTWIQVRDLATGRNGPRIETRMGNMSWADVSWSPDGRLLTSSTGSPDVAVWEAGTGQELARTSFGTDGVRPVLFSPDSRSVLVGTAQGRIHVLAMPDLEPVRAPIDAGVGQLEFLIAHPNGQDVVAIGREARLVNYRSGSVGARVGTTTDVPTSGAFSPDGQRLFVTVAGGGVGLLEVKTMTWIAPPNAAQQFDGSDAAWARDGSLVATSSQDRVGVWDGRTGEFIGSTSGANGALAFTDEGLVTIADNWGFVRTWDPRPRAWVEAACRMAGRDLTEAEWRSYLPEREYDPVCS